MNSLQIGDEVLTSSGEYESVYNFGHMSTDDEMEFIKITTSRASVELSHDHMLYQAENEMPTPAAAVTVGDAILLYGSNEPAIVESIDQVRRQGFYAPLTRSGTIVVNNVVASTFVSLSSEQNPKMVDKGIPVFGNFIVSYQTLSLLWETPNRIIFSLTNSDQIYVGSYSLWSFVGLRFFKYVVLPLGLAGKLLLALVLLLFVPLYIAENLVASITVQSVGFMVSAVGLYHYIKHEQQKDNPKVE